MGALELILLALVIVPGIVIVADDALWSRN